MLILKRFDLPWSQLAEFRKYLKRLSGEQGGISNTSCALVETDIKPSSLRRLDIQGSTTSGQFSPQILAALQAKLLCHPLGNLVTAMKQPALIQSSLQGPKCITAENGIAFNWPYILKYLSYVSKLLLNRLIFVGYASTEFGVWALGSNIRGVNPKNDNMLIDILNQQQHHNSSLYCLSPAVQLMCSHLAL